MCSELILYKYNFIYISIIVPFIIRYLNAIIQPISISNFVFF